MKLPHLSNPLVPLCAFALAAALSVPAAAASYCSGGGTGGLSLADMTLNGASATDCYGVVIGNDKRSAINSLAWGDGWKLLTKDESMVPARFMGVEFDLDTVGGKHGTWTLSARDLDEGRKLDLPAALDIVAVVKASNRYAAYFFDEAVFDGMDGGTWSVAFTNRGGRVPALSHLSFYVRVDGVDGGGVGGGIPAAIPEAHTYAMMLAGLGLVGFMARRGRRTAV